MAIRVKISGPLGGGEFEYRSDFVGAALGESSRNLTPKRVHQKKDGKGPGRKRPARGERSGGGSEGQSEIETGREKNRNKRIL